MPDRSEPRRALPANWAQRILQSAVPGSRVVDSEPLADGFRNSNFKLTLDSIAEPIVVRIYEHDVSLCQKEMDLIRFLKGSVPIPEVIYAQPEAVDDLPPFAVMRYIEGITFRELRRRGDAEAVAHAAWSAGEALAAIHRTIFAKPGWLGPGLTVGAPLVDGENQMARFVDQCLALPRPRNRLSPAVCDRVHDWMWSAAPESVVLERQAHLVHGDFNKRNLLVRSVGGRWAVAAVLDWEFALASTPLTDLGNFLRYERAGCARAEPHFSRGYLDAGGVLPEDWRTLSRVVDMVALCEMLTREALPNDVEAEVIELIQATVERREPAIR